MSIKTTLKLTALSTLAALAFTSHAQAEGKLTVYCSVQNVVCEKVTQAFSKKYNVDAQFVRNSTGVVLGKIKAEKENPQADFWFGGTIEPHLQAAELGLLESYRSPLQKDIMPQFKSLMEQRGNFTSVIYLMELGIGVNTKKLKELGFGFGFDHFDLNAKGIEKLKEFNPDYVKIQSSVLIDFLSDKSGANTKQSLDVVLSSKDIILIAIGVESEEQKSKLIELGIKNMQGIYIDEIKNIG